MRVVFAPEVEEDLYGLIKILVEKEYLGTYPFAISYVEELIADIQQNIHSKLKKKAPAFFERYGKDMYYITYQRNSNTTWYIFFSVIGDTYFIKYITNNHVSIGLSQRNIDVILSPSPPLTIGVINIWLAKIKGCKTIYNVQEIYPDILKRKDGLVIEQLRRMERYVYNNSTAVTTIDQVFYNVIAGRFKDKSKLCIIPNFVDTELYNSQGGNVECLNPHFFPTTDSLKLLYAGNIGYAQDWEPLICLAEKTKGFSIEYFIIGEGVMKPVLEEKVRELELDNVHILPYQPRSLMPSILAYSDIQFIFMNPEMEMQGFPSKVYTIMACGRPLLVCSGKDTPIINFLQEHGCAKLITEKSLEKKVGEMVDWLNSVSRSELALLGRNGVEVIKRLYSKDVVTQKYVDLVEAL